MYIIKVYKNFIVYGILMYKNRDCKSCVSYRCDLLKVLKERELAVLKNKNKIRTYE